MFRETMETDDNLIALVCEGKLSEDDIRRMHALLHKRLAERAKPGLLVDTTAFDGYDGTAAMFADLKMDLSHRNDFSRIAVVGNRNWMEWGTNVVQLLASGEVRWFESEDGDQAAAWARAAR